MSHPLPSLLLVPALLGLVATAGCKGKTDDSTDAAISCDHVGLDIPGGRGELDGVWDADRKRFVLFGGNQAVPINCSPGATDYLGQTWAWEDACGGFVQLEPAESPRKRGRYAAALDPNGRMILHGGRFRAGDSGEYTLFDDVWAFDFEAENWERLSNNKGPSPRFDHGGAILDGKLAVFGGNTSSNGANLVPDDETWAMDLATGKWTEQSTSNNPPPRLYHAVASDGKKLYVYGGGDQNALFSTAFMSDLWALDLASGTWEELHAADGDAPDGRIWPHLSYDATNNRLILFAGHDDTDLGNASDLWQFNLGTNKWKRLNRGDTYNAPANGVCDFPADFTTVDMDGPERRSGAAVGMTDDARMLVFGGKTDCGNANDVWALNLTTDEWELRSKANEGEVCQRFSDSCSSMCF